MPLPEVPKMEGIEIEIEKLINLVHEKPVLWDKSLEEYKSRNLTVDGWRDVCNQLVHGFESMNDKQKNELGKSVMKKWTNIKDSMLRSEKKIASQKLSGAGGPIAKKYLYHKQLAFLKKNMVPNDTNSSFQQCGMEEIFEQCPSSSHSEESTPKKLKTKKTNPDEIEKQIIRVLESSDDRHIHFFKSILPSLQQLNEDEILQFQMGVMQLLSNLRRGRQSTSTATYYPHQVSSLHPLSNYPETVPSGYPLPNYPQTVQVSPSLPNRSQRAQSKHLLYNYAQNVERGNSQETIEQLDSNQLISSGRPPPVEFFSCVKQEDCVDPTSPNSQISEQSLSSVDFSTIE